jgi:hypothetical protein
MKRIICILSFIILFCGQVYGQCPWGIDCGGGATITQTITDGDLTHSPDGNSVYDALAKKWPSMVDADGECLAAAPGMPINNKVYCADNETAGWNPVATILGEANYLVIYDGASYIAIIDEDGNLLLAPPPIIAGDPDTLDDTLATNGADLYNGGTIIYNDAGTATLDAFSIVGQKVRVKFYTGVAIVVTPNAAQTINLRSVNLAQAEALINTSQYGECVLTYLGSNIIDALCSSSITEATP